MVRELLTYILLTLTLSSCSAQWHLRQAVRKDPNLTKPKVVTQTITDTIRISDTIRTVQYDTIVSVDISKPIMPDAPKVIYQDNLIEVLALKQENKELQLKITKLEQVMPYEVVVPYSNTFNLETSEPMVVERTPLELYLLIAFLALVILFLIRGGGKSSTIGIVDYRSSHPP